MKTYIINISHKNRHILQIKYGISTNLYLTFKFNQVLAELAGLLQRKLINISLLFTHLTIYKVIV